MKKFLPIVFLLFSSYTFSETYSCSHTSERIDRPGDTEIKIFRRHGDHFIEDGNRSYIEGYRRRVIFYESPTYLVLSDINEDPTDPRVNVFNINKETKEWGWDFVDIDGYRRYSDFVDSDGWRRYSPSSSTYQPPSLITYGKCTIIN